MWKINLINQYGNEKRNSSKSAAATSLTSCIGSVIQTALDRMPSDDYKVVIRADKRPAGTHERQFNAPTIDEVAVVIVGENLESRDIVLTRRDSGQLQRISETHRSYDALQYPLMFWQGDDGYYINIKLINPLTGEYEYNNNFHFNMTLMSLISF